MLCDWYGEKLTWLIQHVVYSVQFIDSFNSRLLFKKWLLTLKLFLFSLSLCGVNKPWINVHNKICLNNTIKQQNLFFLRIWTFFPSSFSKGIVYFPLAALVKSAKDFEHKFLPKLNLILFNLIYLRNIKLSSGLF